MGELEQELRRFSKEKFESFVFQYLVAKYPGAGIKGVDGAGGDSGVDNFKGELACGPAIWQSKHFPNRIKGPQQKQIIKSIKSAQKLSPALWTLCVPIDLRTPEHKWFQEKVVSKFGGLDHVKLIQASDFLTELQHNRELRDAFFPDNALSNLVKLRRLATLTEQHTENQTAALAVEHANQYLSERTNIEPRLQAVVSIGGSPEMRRAPASPGLVMSITEGEKSTHFFCPRPRSI